jgi:hypothetical protein
MSDFLWKHLQYYLDVSSVGPICSIWGPRQVTPWFGYQTFDTVLWIGSMQHRIETSTEVHIKLYEIASFQNVCALKELHLCLSFVTRR